MGGDLDSWKEGRAVPRALGALRNSERQYCRSEGWAVLFVELVEAALLRRGRRLLMVLNRGQ